MQLSDSVGIENLIGITESHAINRHLILRAADGRPKWKMLAGWMEVDALHPNCWLHLLHIIENEFSPSEQDEIFQTLTAQPHWGNHIRIEFEKQKRVGS